MSIVIRSVVLMFFLGVFLAVSASHAGFDEGVAAANEGQYGTAFQEFSALAEQGDARAQQALAWMYYEGQGRKKDFEKAAYWYDKAAEQGNVTAQINAGLYYHGNGKEHDLSKAFELWQQAAQQGVVEAQRNLGLMYGKGQGVKRNDVQAYVWLNAAAEQNDTVAAKSRDYAKSLLNEVQREEAKSLASEYLRKYVEPFREENKNPH
jgi:TPR repeat protein